MTTRRSPVHIDTPLAPDTPEIPFDPAMKGPGRLRIEIEFNREEIALLKARPSRGSEPLGRFIKRAALEAADREARAKSGDIRAAD